MRLDTKKLVEIAKRPGKNRPHEYDFVLAQAFDPADRATINRAQRKRPEFSDLDLATEAAIRWYRQQLKTTNNRPDQLRAEALRLFATSPAAFDRALIWKHEQVTALVAFRSLHVCNRSD